MARSIRLFACIVLAMLATSIIPDAASARGTSDQMSRKWGGRQKPGPLAPWCGPDARRLCSSVLKNPPARAACMRANFQSLSPTCQNALRRFWAARGMS